MHMQRQIYQLVSNMRRLHLVKAGKYSQIQFKSVILGFYVFLRRLGHAHQTVRCEEIMNLV